MAMLMNDDIITSFGPKPSIKQVTKSENRSNEKLGGLIDEVLAHVEAGRTAQAHSLVDRMMQEYPDHPVIMTTRAGLYELETKYEEASQAYVELSRLYMKRFDPDKALDAAKSALRVTSLSPMAWLTYGQVLARLEDTRGARKAFKEGLKRKRNNPCLADLYLELGTSYYDAAELPKAEDYLRKSLEYEEQAEVWSLLGLVLLRQKQYAEGKAVLERLDLMKDRSDRSVFCALGIANLLLGEKDECRERLTETFEAYSRGQDHLAKNAIGRLDEILAGTKDDEQTWVALLETLDPCRLRMSSFMLQELLRKRFLPLESSGTMFTEPVLAGTGVTKLFGERWNLLLKNRESCWRISCPSMILG